MIDIKAAVYFDLPNPHITVHNFPCNQIEKQGGIIIMKAELAFLKM